MTSQGEWLSKRAARLSDHLKVFTHLTKCTSTVKPQLKTSIIRQNLQTFIFLFLYVKQTDAWPKLYPILATVRPTMRLTIRPTMVRVYPKAATDRTFYHIITFTASTLRYGISLRTLIIACLEFCARPCSAFANCMSCTRLYLYELYFANCIRAVLT